MDTKALDTVRRPHCQTLKRRLAPLFAAGISIRTSQKISRGGEGIFIPRICRPFAVRLVTLPSCRAHRLPSAR